MKGAHWKLLCQLAEQNDTSDSIKQSFRKLKKAKDEDARRERARAKEAKAAERKEYHEERAKLQALGEEICSEHANRPRRRKKAARRSEAELRALGGEKAVIPLGESRRQTRWIFGPEGQTRFIHTPEDGLWRLDAKPGALKGELKSELNKTRRNLWNVDKEQMDIAAQAVDALLACSQDWQGFPPMSKSEQEHAMIYAQLAILTTLQALKRDVKNESRKLQLAFKWKEGEGSPSKSVKLCDHALMLASELQRPPSKKELKDRFDSTLPQQHPIHESEFSKLLKAAGLSWLKRGPRGPSW